MKKLKHKAQNTTNINKKTKLLRWRTLPSVQSIRQHESPINYNIVWLIRPLRFFAWKRNITIKPSELIWAMSNRMTLWGLSRELEQTSTMSAQLALELWGSSWKCVSQVGTWPLTNNTSVAIDADLDNSNVGKEDWVWSWSEMSN